MLKAKALAQVLGQLNTGDIVSTMLFTAEGALLASSTSTKRSESEKLFAAIAANVWTTLQSSESAGEMQTVLVECEEGRLAMAKVHRFLLLVRGTKNVELGLLRAKAEAAARYLAQPLSAYEA